jgi:hypothetical protein
MSINQNNSKIVTTCGQRLAALKKYVKTKTALQANGKTLKPAALVAVYQSAIDTRTALVSQRAVFNQALAARDNAETTRVATDKDLKFWVINTFGENSQEAEEFGFLPPKVGEKTVATKAIAVEKTLATRKARGTMGKQQKKEIKGTIVAPAAPADPAVTTPAATPAVVASSPAAPSTNGPSTSGVAASH